MGKLCRWNRLSDLVVTEDLWKVYTIGTVEYPALRGLDANIYGGEFIAVVGPSGSGKSTLLHIIGGLDKPTRGRVIVGGSDLSELGSDQLAEYRNRKVGFVFQFYNLIPYLTALENVGLSLSIANVDPETRNSRAMVFLEMFGLQTMASKKPTELSGGEQQRVAIARALINEPSLILADEPTGNVDSESAKVVVAAFRKLVTEQEVSVVMVTHNRDLTQFCDRVIKLKDGRLDGIEVIAR
jgi:putative ABC transport system ATP-binding protein